MSFRSGRKLARHTYPEPPRGGGGTSGPFARNYAEGPDDTVILQEDPGVQIPWAAIDVGAPGVNVPITPQSTGVVRVTGVLTVHNRTTDPEIDSNFQIIVQVDGVDQPFPFFENPTVAQQEGVSVAQFLAEITGLAVGVQVNISILLIAEDTNATELTASGSSIEVIEVGTATG